MDRSKRILVIGIILLAIAIPVALAQDSEAATGSVTVQVDPLTPWGTIYNVNGEYDFGTSTFVYDAGTPISISGSTLYIGTDAYEAEAQTSNGYTYSFVQWTVTSNVVNGSVTATALFSSTGPVYVQVSASPMNQGRLSLNGGTPTDNPIVIEVAANSTWTTSGSDLIICSGRFDWRVTPIPTQGNEEFTYAFAGWSPSSGTVSTSGASITANFTATQLIFSQEFDATPSEYGATSVAILNDVESGIGWSISGNAITIGNTTVTATPTSAGIAQDFTFDHWEYDGTAKADGSTGTVTADGRWTAVFDTTRVLVTVTPTDYGSVNLSNETPTRGPISFLAPLNSTWTSTATANGGVMTFRDANDVLLARVVATPEADIEDFDYAFTGWSPQSGTVSGDTAISASFSSTQVQFAQRFAASPDGYGTTSVAVLNDVESGIGWSASGNAITIGNTTVTATPTPSDLTSQYDYSFDHWEYEGTTVASGSTGTVTGDGTWTAYFTAAARYTVTVTPNQSPWGTLQLNSQTPVNNAVTFTVPAGTAWTTSGAVATFANGGTTVATVTAAPISDTEYFEYAFTGWSPSSGTVASAGSVITATFTQTQIVFDILLSISPTGYGTVYPSVFNDVETGTAWSVSGPTLTIGSRSVTAIPTPSDLTSQYDYHFDHWTHGSSTVSDGSSGTITDDDRWTAVFTRTARYAVTVTPVQASWGHLSLDGTEVHGDLSITVTPGTAWTTSGDTLTFTNGGNTVATVTATPTDDTVDFDFDFTGWSPSSGTVASAGSTITATFTRSQTVFDAFFSAIPSQYSTVSSATLTDIEYGTVWTVTGTTITFDNGYTTWTVTASRTADGVHNEFTLDHWELDGTRVADNSTGTVSSDLYWKAVYTTPRHTVTINPSQSAWGTLQLNSEAPVHGPVTFLAPAGVEWTSTYDANGGTLTLTHNGLTFSTVYAAATADTEDFDYAFAGWSPASGTVGNADLTITATFTSNQQIYSQQFAAAPVGYGNTSVSVLNDVESGIGWSVSGNTVTIGNTVVTATPTPSDLTSQYDYHFSNWTYGGNLVSDGSTGTVTGDGVWSANFTRTPRYAVTVSPSQASWGHLNVDSEAPVYGDLQFTISAGTTWTTAGNVLTFSDGTTVTANPTDDDEYHDYAFAGWSPQSGTVSGATSIDAAFTDTQIYYDQYFTPYPSGYGYASPGAVTDLEYGTPWSVSGATVTFTVGGIARTVTATPAASTDRYDFHFDHWEMEGNLVASGSTGTVTADSHWHAVFDTTDRYTVTIVPKEASWGTVSRGGSAVYGPITFTVPAGTTWAPYGTSNLRFSSNGSLVAVVTASPTNDNEYFEYDFDHWYPSIGTVDSDGLVITAYFTQTEMYYDLVMQTSPAGGGTVSPAAVNDVEAGTRWVADGNTLTIGNTVVTATPTASDAHHQYRFLRWMHGSTNILDGQAGTITTSDRWTAVFEAIELYTVVVNPSESRWGTLQLDDQEPVNGPVAFTAPAGTIWASSSTSSGGTLTFRYNGDTLATVRAEANDDAIDFDYGFTGFTAPTGTLTSAGAQITATFTQAQTMFDLIFSASPSGAGTVSRQSLYDVEYGRAWVVSDNTVTIGSTVITASLTSAGISDDYQFHHWEFNGVAKADGSAGIVSADGTWTAVFVTARHAVTVTAAHSEWGTLRLNGGAAIHGSVTFMAPTNTTWSSTYNSLGGTITFTSGGTTIAVVTANLTAEDTEDFDYYFGGWSPSSGTVPSGGASVTANFAATQLQFAQQFTVSPEGYGTVSPSILNDVESGLGWRVSGNTVTFGVNTVVTATAKASDSQYDYRFDHWTLDGVTKADGSSGTVTADNTWAAVFTSTARTTVTITASPSSWGDIQLNSETPAPVSVQFTVPINSTWSSSGDEMTFSDGTTVTAVPTDSDDYHIYAFSSWSRPSGTVGSSAISITATFSETSQYYDLYFASDDTSMGTVSQAVINGLEAGTTWSVSGRTITFTSGNTVRTVSANPASSSQSYDYHFDYWTLDGSAIASGSSGTVTTDGHWRAYFAAQDRYTVTVKPNQSSWGTLQLNSQSAIHGAVSFTVSQGTSWNIVQNTGGMAIEFREGANPVARVTASPTSDDDYFDYAFTGWSPQSGTVGSEGVVIDANFSATQLYYDQFFTVSPSGYGYVSQASLTGLEAGTTWTISGNEVAFTNGYTSWTITATPADGSSQQYYEFDHWSFGGTSKADGSTGTVLADGQWTANFTAIPLYTVTVTPNQSPWGTLQINSEAPVNGSVSFPARQGVTWTSSGNEITFSDGTTVTAEPDGGDEYHTYAFASWSPSSGTVGASAVTITANFSATQLYYDQFFTADPVGYGTVSRASLTGLEAGTAWTISGNEIAFTNGYTSWTIAAEPSSPSQSYGFAFDYWSLDGTALASGDSGDVSSDGHWTANFTTTDRYTVVVSPSPSSAWGTLQLNNQTPVNSSVSVNVPTGSTWGIKANTNGMTIEFKDGSSVLATVTAEPDGGDEYHAYAFTGWSPQSGTVNGPATIDAIFTSTQIYFDEFFEAYPSDYGRVSTASILGLETGTVWTIDGNEITFDNGYTRQTVTAIPRDSSSIYDYSLAHWYLDGTQKADGSSGTVTADGHWRASFTRTPRYTVTITPSESQWGTLTLDGGTPIQGTVAFSVPTGTTWTSSATSVGGTITFVKSGTTVATVVAEAISGNEYHEYAFASWSPSSGTVSGPTSVTATFTDTQLYYDQYFVVIPSNYGTVSPASLTDLEAGTAWSVSGNEIEYIVGGISQTITADPATSTSSWDFHFDHWTLDGTTVADGSTGTVLADGHWQAHFTRTPRYNVTITPSPSSAWGTLQVDDGAPVSGYVRVNVPVNSTWAVKPGTDGLSIEFHDPNNNLLHTVTADPDDGDEYHSYTFGYWSPASGTVTRSASILAVFIDHLNYYDQYFTVQPSGYGTVHPATVNDLEAGTAWSISGNAVTFNYGSTTTTVRATPRTADVQHDYIFDYWTLNGDAVADGSTGTVTDIGHWQAVFTTTDRYTVTVEPSPSSAWGTLRLNDQTPVEGTLTFSVPAGTTWTSVVSASDSTMTFLDGNGNQVARVTAEPDGGDEYHAYAFSSWSPSSGTVNAAVTITATFATQQLYYDQYFTASPAGYGTVSPGALTDLAPGTAWSVSGNEIEYIVGGIAQTVTATPTPSDLTSQYDYHFVKWQLDNADVSDGSAGTVLADGHWTAVFTATDRHAVTITPNQSSWGTFKLNSQTPIHGNLSFTVPDGSTWTSVASAARGTLTFVKSGTTVATVIAEPVSDEYHDYAFEYWNPSSGTVASATSISATFSDTQIYFDQYFVAEPSGYGTVSPGAVNGLDPGATWRVDGNKVIITNNGTTRTVTAQPAGNTLSARYYFDHWELEDVIKSDGQTGTIADDGHWTAVFTFQRQTYTVNIAPSNANGTVYPQSVSDVPYGTVFAINSNGSLDIGGTTVTAIASSGFHFLGWSVDDGDALDNLTFPTMAVGRPITITATFDDAAPVNVHVTIRAGIGGTVSSSGFDVPYGTEYQAININGTPAVIFTYDGSNIHTVTATPTSPCTFNSWSSSAGTVTTPMSIEAMFNRPAYTVTIQADSSTPYGTVSPSSVANVPWGTTIAIGRQTIDVNGTAVTATPYQGDAHTVYYFDQWTSSITPSFGTVTVTGNLTLTATFYRQILYDVTVSIPSGQTTYGRIILNDGNPSTSVTFAVPAGTSWTSVSDEYGDRIMFFADDAPTVYAIATDDNEYFDYSFTGWSPSHGTVGMSAVTITASFSVSQLVYGMTFDASPEGYGSVSPSVINEVEDGLTWTIDGNEITFGANTVVTATPSSSTDSYDYRFDHWELGGATQPDGSTGTVSADGRWTAVFTRSDRYMVTIASNQSQWGTIQTNDQSAHGHLSFSVPDGTAWSTSGTASRGTITFTHGGDTVATVTLTPKDADDYSTYSFAGCEPASGTVNGRNESILVIFTQTLIYYSQGFSAYPSSFGSVTAASVDVPSGATWTVSGDTITFVNGNDEWTVTATPSGGTTEYERTLDHWNLDNTPLADGSTGTVAAPASWTAIFVQDLRHYSVTLSAIPPTVGHLESGGIDLGPNHTYSVAYGTAVSLSGDDLIIGIGSATITVSPVPTIGYEFTSTFDRWTRNGSDFSGTVVNQDMTIVASFDSEPVPKLTVAIAAGENGYVDPQSVQVFPHTSVSVRADGTLVFSDGQTVAAIPDPGYAFSAWLGIPQDGYIMADTTLTATFVPVTYHTLTFAVDPPGSATLSQDAIEDVPYGTVIDISGNTVTVGETVVTATANPLFTLAGWSLPDGEHAVTGDLTLTAIFTSTLPDVTVTIRSYDDNQGWVTLQVIEDVPNGTPVRTDGNRLTINGTTVTAVAEDGYVFLAWSVPDGYILTKDITIIAYFDTTYLVWYDSGYINGAIAITFNFTERTTDLTHYMKIPLVRYDGIDDSHPQQDFDGLKYFEATDYTLHIINGYSKVIAVILTQGENVLYTMTYDPGTWNVYSLAIDLQNGTLDFQGIASPLRPAGQTANMITYKPIYIRNIADWSAVNPEGMAAKQVYHADDGSGSTHVHFQVRSTLTYLDTYGFVMQDPYLDVGAYFTEYSDLRLNLYSFALYGDALTINDYRIPFDGSTATLYYTEIDEQRFIATEDTPGAKRYTPTFQNVFITWTNIPSANEENRHCFLTFVDDRRMTIDMGTYDDMILSGEGMWYFTTALWEPYLATETTVTMDWYSWDGLSANGFLLVFIAVEAIAAVAFAYYYRMELIDYIVIVVAAALAYFVLGWF